MSYTFTPCAKTDLEEIWAYIASDIPDAADALEADIYHACEILASHPDMGSVRPTWTDKRVRFFPVRKNFLIVYRATGKPLMILRILNAARDVPRLFAENLGQ